MSRKTRQLQIRVTVAEKRGLRARARAAGLDLSAYVLARALPDAGVRFRELVGMLADDATRRPALAEIHDLLASVVRMELADAVPEPVWTGVPPWAQNYVAALVEQAADQLRIAPPDWVGRVQPLETPHFATSLRTVRPYLLVATPVPFKRRNVFTDAGLGARV